MESTTIRKGKKADLAEVLELIKELAVFEKAPDEVTNTLADLEKDGFGHKPVFELVVAEENGKLVGMAIYFIKYSTWKGKGIYLEDIIVKESHRLRGIGKKLFNAVIDEAKTFGAKQLHWQVLDWNTPAIRFYDQYKPSFDKGWVNCKMNETQLSDFQT